MRDQICSQPKIFSFALLTWNIAIYIFCLNVRGFLSCCNKIQLFFSEFRIVVAEKKTHNFVQMWTEIPVFSLIIVWK